jgi:hypothetical protein
VRMRLYPVGSGAVIAVIHNAGDATADGIRMSLHLPGGWLAAPGTRLAVATLRAGATVRVTWRLTAAVVQAAPVRVDLTWSGPGGSGAALRTFATGTANATRR